MEWGETRGGGCARGRAGGAVVVVGVAVACAVAASASRVFAQALTARGFVEMRGDWYLQDSPIDPTRGVGDLHARAEAAADLARWLRVRAGVDGRLDTYGQVDRTWALDWFDRARRRRALAVRELNASFAWGRLTVEVGKQFVRWGAVDVASPVDRFTPRDYLTVVDDELLAVTGARVAYGGEATRVEAVWVPHLTPSRVPLYDKRWTVVPDLARGVRLVDGGAVVPRGAQTGVRWSRVGAGYEYALSYYHGFQHLPSIDAAIAPPAVVLTRRFPRLRSLGGALAWPLPWLTLKTDAAYVWAPDRDADEYSLYVIQVERQRGELFLVAGYAGEVVGRSRGAVAFAPDRGLARAFFGKARYTIDPNREVSLEMAVRQTLEGVWLRGEYSHAVGAHWRATLGGGLVRGASDDFIGQFRRNSFLSASWRFNF